MGEINKDKIVNFLVFLVPIIGILFVFREIVFNHKIFSHLDVLLAFVPYYTFLSGGTGLISHSIMSGFSVYVSTNSSWFNPLNKIVFHFLDSVDTFRFLDISYLVLAYVFSYLFMRRIKISHFASIFGSTVFIFAGQVMLWSETIIMASYYFMMPLAMYLLDMAFNSKPLRGFFLYILLGVCLGYGWTSGHVQFLIYAHTFVCLYFLFLLWQAHKEKIGRKLVFTQVIFILLTLGISLLVGYAQIKPILDFLPITARASGVTLGAATAYAYSPHHLIYYLLPFFKVPYISLSQSFHNYIGIFPLMVFSLCFFVRKELRANKHFLFFFWVFVFCFLASVKYSPIAFVMHYLPLYNAFRETFRIMFVGDFALAIALAIGIEQLWQSRESIYPKINTFLVWTKRIFIWLFLPVVAFFSIIKIFFFDTIENYLRNYFLTHLYSNTVGGFPLEHYYQIINSYLHQSIDQLYIFNFGMIALPIFALASWFLVKNIKNLSYRHFFILVIIVTVANFSLIYMYRVLGIPKNDLISLPKTALFIKNRETSGEPFRIFSPLMSVTIFDESVRCSFPDLGNWDISHKEFGLRKELIEPNLPIIYGLESADGYEPYMPVRMSEILSYVGSRFAVTSDYVLSGEGISLTEKIKKLEERKNIYRVLNVKYILTLFPILNKDFKLVYEEEVGDCKSKLHIYELSNSFPRYFLTNKVFKVEKNESFLSQMDRIESFDSPSIMLEAESLLPLTKSSYFQKIFPVLKDGDRRRFVIDAPKNTYFLIGEALLPGSRAIVDGRAVSLLRANYIYSAIYLSQGKHTIELEYKK